MLPDQNLPWWRSDRPWGFRFSIPDAVILIVGGAVTVVGWRSVGVFALVVPFLLLHFLLFCNTFRIGGERSLIWVAAFLINVFLWTVTGWNVVHLMAQLLVTAVLVVHCVVSVNYHGIACCRINPLHYRSGAYSEGAFTRRVLLACCVPVWVVEILVGRKLEEFHEE